MTEQTQTPEAAQEAAPGARLRAAREAKKWTIGGVAAQLHLEARQVAALEADDFARLPEPIYVCGYLRSYARLLNLPEQDVVAAYQRGRASVEPVPLPLRSRRRDPAAVQSALQWGAVVVVGAGLVFIGWHMHTTPPPPAALPDTAAAVTAVPAPPARDGSAVGTALAAEPPAAAADLGGGAPVPAKSAAVPAEAGAEPAPAPVNASAPGTTPSLRAATSVSTVAASSAPGAGPVPAALVGADELLLHFRDNSWVEIEDGTGQRVFYDMGQPGQTRAVHGAPPFKVLLGYAPGVSIEYHGTPFDSSAFTAHNNVARFTVGG